MYRVKDRQNRAARIKVANEKTLNQEMSKIINDEIYCILHDQTWSLLGQYSWNYHKNTKEISKQKIKQPYDVTQMENGIDWRDAVFVNTMSQLMENF